MYFDQLSGAARTRKLVKIPSLKGYSLCERSTLWVYFISQICYHDTPDTCLCMFCMLEINENHWKMIKITFFIMHTRCLWEAHVYAWWKTSNAGWHPKVGCFWVMLLFLNNFNCFYILAFLVHDAKLLFLNKDKSNTPNWQCGLLLFFPFSASWQCCCSTSRPSDTHSLCLHYIPVPTNQNIKEKAQSSRYKFYLCQALNV